MRLKIFLNEMPYDDALSLLSSLDDTFPKENITSEIISKYRRKLAMKYHPDKNPLKKTETTHLMQQVNDALDSLEKYQGGGSGSWSHREKPDTAEDFADYFRKRRKEYDNHYKKKENYKYQRPYEEGYEPWSWAGYSGGTPDSDHIYDEVYASPKDKNWVKKQGWILGGKKKKPKPSDEYTYWMFDGNYSKGVMSAFTSGKHYDFIPYFLKWCDGTAKAVVITQEGTKFVTAYIIDNGKILNDAEGVHYKMMKHNSFNGNPFNDNANNSGTENNFVDNLKLHISIMMKKYGGK